MALPAGNEILQKYLDDNKITATYSGNDATLTSTLNARQVRDLVRAAQLSAYDLNVITGTAKLQVRVP